MEQQKTILWVALAIVTFMIWQSWIQWNAKPLPPQNVQEDTTAAPQIKRNQNAGNTNAPPAPAEKTLPNAPRARPSAQSIHVLTDVYEARIDTQGGDIRYLTLRQYPISVEEKSDAFVLLRDDGGLYAGVQSGIIGHNGPYPDHSVLYTAEKEKYSLKDGEESLEVRLNWHSGDVSYVKTYTFHRNSYVVDVHYEINNRGTTDWRGYLYAQFEREPPPSMSIFSPNPSFNGGAFYASPDHKQAGYNKVSFSDMEKKPGRFSMEGGWIAMLQHYFLTAFLPAEKKEINVYYRPAKHQHFVMGYNDAEPTRILPGTKGLLKTKIYLGPKAHKHLSDLSEGLPLAIDYGWLTFISQPLFVVLSWIHNAVGNWGWAIIILTIIIKLIFFPLSATSYRSMANLRRLQPRMVTLRERYKDDKQQLQKAMMELYRNEKINPLGGCLPILVQIPVFLALYWVLIESVELRQADFIFWLKDLSVRDPYFVLPLIMGASMFVQQKLNPPAPDPIQQKVLTFMPILFTGLFLFFPAGLVLYWVVNNVLSIAQQWYITKRYSA